MRTILNMKPGPGGRRLQKELEAKTSGSVYWPAFTFDRSEDYEESVKEILEGAERGALLILVSPTTVSFMKDIFRSFLNPSALPVSANRPLKL